MASTINNEPTNTMEIQMTQYGETSWDASGQGEGGGKVEFIRLSQGEHKFRIVTNPFKYPVHRGIKAEGQDGFGRKVNCSKTDTQSCPLCSAGLQVKTQYMFGVIDRSTGTFKVIDVSWQIFSIINGLVTGGIWGDPKNYDLMIKKNPKSKGPSDYYTVQPVPKEPLSVDDQRIRDEADIEYLRRKTTQPTTEETAKWLAKILEGGMLYIPEPEEKPVAKSSPRSAAPKSNGSSKKASMVPSAEMTDDESIEDTFTDFDAN